MALLPLMNPTTYETEFFGGIDNLISLLPIFALVPGEGYPAGAVWLFSLFSR